MDKHVSGAVENCPCCVELCNICRYALGLEPFEINDKYEVYCARTQCWRDCYKMTRQSHRNPEKRICKADRNKGEYTFRQFQGHFGQHGQAFVNKMWKSATVIPESVGTL